MTHKIRLISIEIFLPFLLRMFAKIVAHNMNSSTLATLLYSINYDQSLTAVVWRDQSFYYGL